jgi:hypothetical protein
MRLILGGGRATEDSESKGSVIVGVRTLSEGGCVGNFSREQVSSLVHMLLLWKRSHGKSVPDSSRTFNAFICT